MGKPRIAIAARSLDDVLVRLPGLIKAVRARGAEILCIAASSDDPKTQTQCIDFLTQQKITYRLIEQTAKGSQARNAYRKFEQLRSYLVDWRTETLLCCDTELAVYAVPAGRRAGAARCVAVCDMLPEFLQPHATRNARPVARFALRWALTSSDHVSFHNTGHKAALLDNKLVNPSQNISVLPGWGVSVEATKAQPLPELGDSLTFVMAARQQAVRGCLNYLDAIKRAALDLPKARFVFQAVPGRRDFDVSSAGPIPANFEYRGQDCSLHDTLKAAHVFVYPSHSEGMASELLTALAVGRPVITTDMPGCRECVDETVNGILVERGNVKALADAMVRLAGRRKLLASMARASRIKAEKRFAQSRVHDELFQILGV